MGIKSKIIIVLSPNTNILTQGFMFAFFIMFVLCVGLEELIPPRCQLGPPMLNYLAIKEHGA
jgi:hypothetical protein